MSSTFPSGTVYYGHQIYMTYSGKRPRDLPDGAYIYEKWLFTVGWYTSDFCPCLIEDVPAETRTIRLLTT